MLVIRHDKKSLAKSDAAGQRPVDGSGTQVGPTGSVWRFARVPLAKPDAAVTSRGAADDLQRVPVECRRRSETLEGDIDSSCFLGGTAGFVECRSPVQAVGVIHTATRCSPSVCSCRARRFASLDRRVPSRSARASFRDLTDATRAVERAAAWIRGLRDATKPGWPRNGMCRRLARGKGRGRAGAAFASATAPASQRTSYAGVCVCVR